MLAEGLSIEAHCRETLRFLLFVIQLYVLHMAQVHLFFFIIGRPYLIGEEAIRSTGAAGLVFDEVIVNVKPIIFVSCQASPLIRNSFPCSREVWQK